MTVTQRVERPEDGVFLRRLILETISIELGTAAWPEPARSHLLEIQYSGRRHAGHFPEAESRLIEAEGSRAGWLLLASLPHEVRIVEVMVSSERQGQGIGTEAIRQIQADAAESGRPVRLTVNLTNARAISLYERLGFKPVESNEVQWVMEYMPPA